MQELLTANVAMYPLMGMMSGEPLSVDTDRGYGRVAVRTQHVLRSMKANTSIRILAC